MTVYIVYAQGLDRDTVLGHATGEVEDIEAYFHDRRQYGLRIEPVSIVDVQEGHAEKRRQLLEQKKKLQSELLKIEMQLGG